MRAPLIIAVPSKGRLQEEARAALARAGLNVVQAGNARSYRGAIALDPRVGLVTANTARAVSRASAGYAGRA